MQKPKIKNVAEIISCKPSSVFPSALALFLQLHSVGLFCNHSIVLGVLLKLYYSRFRLSTMTLSRRYITTALRRFWPNGVQDGFGPRKVLSQSKRVSQRISLGRPSVQTRASQECCARGQRWRSLKTTSVLNRVFNGAPSWRTCGLRLIPSRSFSLRNSR